MFLQDLIYILEHAGIGLTYGTNVFVGSRAILPTGDGPFVVLIETGGSAPEGTHNLTDVPAYVQPSAQVVCHALDYLIARDKAQEIYEAFYAIMNQLVNGTFWRSISPKQEPFDLGLDDAGRARVVFNIECVKRLSPATSY